MHDLPQTFGKYELLESIGSGGMAEIFLARTYGLAGFEKTLVIKRIRSEHAQDPSHVASFVQEAKIGVHLNHPNIIQLYELGRVGSDWYIAMEHLHGKDLSQVRRVCRNQNITLPPQLVVSIIADVCRGLAYAHSTPFDASSSVALVHRDVSPHNLFLTYTGQVKVVDFGIAKLAERHDKPPKPTQESSAPPRGGKFAYMSPEQAKGLPVDHRSDLYSVGVVLWELLTGKRFIPEGSLEERHALARNPAPLDLSGIDPSLHEALQRSLAPSPEDRYSDIDLLEEALRAWLHERRTRVGPAERAEFLRSLFPEASAKNPTALDVEQMLEDLDMLDPTTPSVASSIPERSNPAETPQIGGDHTSGQRRRVVVLYLETEGLTEPSQALEPEAFFRHQLKLYRWLHGIVSEHGGQIQRLQDDQAVIFFGLPRTRADDARRCVDCAWELQHRTKELSRKGINIQLAIGVNAGEITVGTDNQGPRLRYTSRGGTLRLARKLSQYAGLGQVLLSESIFKSLQDHYEATSGPWLLPRGDKAPRRSWLLVKQLQTALGVTGKWIRRGDELDRIKEAIVALNGGAGSTLVISGEAGTGKSRFVREICAVAERYGMRRFFGRTSPFGSAFRPFQEIVRAVLGLHEQDNASTTERIRELRTLGLYPRDLEAIATLLGVGTTREPDESNLRPALTRLFKALGDQKPMLIVFEDAHELTRRAISLLRGLLSALQGSGVLFLVTWSGSDDTLQDFPHIELGPFDETHQLRMVGLLLRVHRLDKQLAALVVDTCEGNPLYIEELTRYLLAESLVEVREGVAYLVRNRHIKLPDSLAGLIAARIDALDPASRGTLQMAAVIGMRFTQDLLAEVIGVEDAAPLVETLSESGLLIPTEQTGEWTFPSEFVREAAQRRLLGIQRREHHRLIAAAIERRYHDDLSPWYTLLAFHCGRGGRLVDAARFDHAAGQRSEKRQHLAEARRSYSRGLQWLRKAPEDPSTYAARMQGETLLRLRLGTVLIQQGHLQQGLGELQLSLEISADGNISWLEARAHLELGKYFLQVQSLQRAKAHLDLASRLSAHEDDPELRLSIAESLARLADQTGDHEQSEALWEQAIAQEGSSPQARVRSLFGRAKSNLRKGEFQTALPLLNRALHYARAANDAPMEGRVLNHLGLVYAWDQQLDEALTHFRRALQVREEHGDLRGAAVNHHNVGDVHFMRGEMTRAYLSFQRSREVSEEIGWQKGIALNDIYLGYIDAVRDGDEEGLNRLADAIERSKASGSRETAITGTWLTGRALLHQQHVEGAKQHLEQALEDAKAHGFRPLTRLIEETLRGIRP